MAIEVPSGVVLLAGEASLLSPGDNLPLVGQRKQGGVVWICFFLQHWQQLPVPQHFKSVQAVGLSAVLKVEGFIV